ncbi:MAG: hypothetical protein R3F43_29100 [bacterium]
MEQKLREDLRFGGIERLYGRAARRRTRRRPVAVVGIRKSLLDGGGPGPDGRRPPHPGGHGRDLRHRNTRQIHTVEGTVGRAKVDAMAERVRLIHPDCVVTPVAAFFRARTAAELLARASTAWWTTSTTRATKGAAHQPVLRGGHPGGDGRRGRGRRDHAAIQRPAIWR